MTYIETLNKLLEKKIERQALLSQKSKEFKALHDTISGAKKGRWLGSSYLLIKRILSIFIGVALILIALFFLLFPEIILENQELHDSLMKGAKAHYLEVTGETITQTLINITSDEYDFNYNSTASMLENLEDGMEKSLEKEIILGFQSLSGLLIILAFVFLYISRMSRKMKVRNQKISSAETITQEIIQSFTKNIIEEEKELILLQEMIRTSIKDNTPPHRP
ncbi:hypothetical protein [uncultured Dokdonia sp.]|uniref:hypothetical protein n=1 Tax=uncultured Dokdonia sp. TaxID=575653 RepID=UPI00261CC8F6|nr:hypothetical protein [uncultured Dokdonia sp.]